MSYLDKNLLPDERVLFRTKKHKIIFLSSVIWTIFAALATYYMESNTILYRLSWAPWVVAAVFWSYALLEYWFSEYAVTNKRAMMREGFFYRHTNELRLSTISQVNVDQSLLGQILNYGTVSINAFGAFDAYPLIDKPFLFQKYVNGELDQLTK